MATAIFLPVLIINDGPCRSTLAKPLDFPALEPKIWLFKLSVLKELLMFFKLKEALLLPTFVLIENKLRSKAVLLSAMFAGLKKAPLTPV